ncbi:MAG: DUF1841 family protein [Ferruginibacter sp.]
MKTNPIVKKEMLTVVENQLNTNTPPETKITYNRLIQTGISEVDAKNYIAQCVAVEIFNVMKYKQPFDAKRFIKNLNNLPKEPFDDES